MRWDLFPISAEGHRDSSMTTTTLLRLPSVKARTGLSRSTIYLRISQGDFPRPVSLGGRAVGGRTAVAWIEAEIDAWINERVKASRQGRLDNV